MNLFMKIKKETINRISLINKRDAELSNYKKRLKRREEIEIIKINKGTKEEIDKKYLGY